ncbi:hypothetical protein PYCCODRAFT_1429453 [Trametes coccinea BRFM310]|uniref:Uncharacterized protein n=1 Tax=Trametes coccinea (strain BRFM310) TaxID=1353009 RepID=A0A1Y2J692_TRAC3|nr:hypothetical protein PYCCODRAFT_1429453 [Trametes coccinea BRFM310]
MLLKLSSSDIRDTALVDCATDEVVYRTCTSCPSSSRSRSSSTSSWASSTRSREKLPERNECTTVLLDCQGEAVAEIAWEGNHASMIRIREEVLQGTTELFDASFVRVLPDETFLPTRLEYTWRITPETLTLLDDDDSVIGRLYADCTLSRDRPVPALQPHTGSDYFELNHLPPDDLLEVIMSYLLVRTLRDRLYSVTKYVYGRPKRPLANLRLHATRSFANLRDSLRRTMSPSTSHH